MRVVEKRQLLSAEEIDRTLSRLAHEIVEKSGGAQDLAFDRGAAARRAAVAAAGEGHQGFYGRGRAGGNSGHHAVSRRSFDGGPAPGRAIDETSHLPVDDRDLVVVDDVLYTGRTIRAAMNGLFDLGRPKRVRLCVLIDRGHRELPVEATFVGRNVQTSDTEIVEVRLKEIDGEERVMLVDRVS